jgi:hypothetical protein
VFLVMDEIDGLFQGKPLLRFSAYTVTQIQTLLFLADELQEILEVALVQEGVVGPEMEPFYGSFWLWTLGASELVQTMYQAKNYFAQPAQRRIQEFKREIAEIRVLLAKQEFASEHDLPIDADGLIYGFDFPGLDVKIDVNGRGYSVRGLLNRFSILINWLESDRADHRDETWQDAPQV